MAWQFDRGENIQLWNFFFSLINLSFYDTEILRYIEIFLFENDIIFAILEFAKRISLVCLYIKLD